MLLLLGILLRATFGIVFMYICIAPFLKFSRNVLKIGTKECQMLGPQHEPAIVDFTDSWPHNNQHVSDKLLYYGPLTPICRRVDFVWDSIMIMSLIS